MNQSDIVQQIENLPSNKVKFAITDMDGILRGKIIHKSKLLKSLKSGLGFCDVIFGWDSNDRVYENSSTTGLHTGYPDAFARIDLSTLRMIPWEDNLPFYLADFEASSVQDICPRTLLKRTIAKAEQMGFKAMMAMEFEWFNFKETPNSLANKNYAYPTPITPGMFGYSMIRLGQNKDYFNQLFDQLEDFGIPLEGLHTETGSGVMEAAILYNEALPAADKAVLFKFSVKQIAHQHEMMAGFMAKWNSQLPGCSGHIHQSLWDFSKEKNLFSDEQGMSKVMQHYLAGQIACLPYILPMLAPTINSYKRLAGGDWAPATLSWGIENRTTAFRIINHTVDATRIEGRISGADANPYLAMAAYLAAGLYGIEQELPLTMPATKGNGYQSKKNDKLPLSLQAATLQMKQSDLPKRLFGKAFVDHFIATREWEWQQYQKQVTDWELRRYFEII